MQCNKRRCRLCICSIVHTSPMRKKLRLLSRRMATGRNEGNKDKAVRRHEKEATRRNRTRKNGRCITPSSTLKIVSRNEVVDLDDLVALAPLVACALT